jgi:hypothetical protein
MAGLPRKWTLAKVGAAGAILAGAAVLVIDIRRSIQTGSFELWFWGPIGALAVIFGVYELFFAADEPEDGDGGPQP